MPLPAGLLMVSSFGLLLGDGNAMYCTTAGKQTRCPASKGFFSLSLSTLYYSDKDYQISTIQNDRTNEPNKTTGRLSSNKNGFASSIAPMSDDSSSSFLLGCRKPCVGSERGQGSEKGVRGNAFTIQIIVTRRSPKRYAPARRAQILFWVGWTISALRKTHTRSCDKT